MMRPHSHKWHLAAGLPLLALGASTAQSLAEFSSPSPNPISRIARLFDSQLVQVEDRVSWLDGQLSSYAKHYEYPLKTGLGYRAGRNNPGDPDPSIVLDLGSEQPIEQIFLIPAQPEFPNAAGIFPKRFTLELSTREDFGQRTILYTSGTKQFPDPEMVPASFKANGTARYVRLTVHAGHYKGMLDLFGLSEIAVFANGQPVSFGAPVSAVGGLDLPGMWYPAALTDGRTPLGIWQNGGKPSNELGDAVMLENPEEPTTWTVRLPDTAALDQIVLFPYQFNRSIESSAFPESLTIQLGGEGPDRGETIYEWTNPLPGASSTTPLVVRLQGHTAKTLHITATRPSLAGNRQVHALSEIQVWAQGTNLADGLPVERNHRGEVSTIHSLTDGYTSQDRIIPVLNWLHQLYQRGIIERELSKLRPVQRQLSANSELNATWGSAVILGLTFLIPVFIVERRRLMSKEQLDQIRKRIASDLHDDIGSNLGSISLIARTARKDLVRLEGPDEIAQDLDEVETIARESSLAMRDIVWLLERRQDSIGDLVQRMRETANRLLREITFTLDCNSNKTAAKLTLDAKRHLFLFYKEAIHNILKHSHASRVSIRLWDEDDKLALEIVDDGIGIPSSPENRPASVNKLQDRARVLDGLLQIASAKGTGTRICLLVKRSHLTSHPVLS